MTKLKRKESLLWEITNQETGNTSYLFGTMHIRDNRAFRYLNIIKAKISRCKLYAAEFDLHNEGNMEFGNYMEMDDQQIDQLIPEKKYKKLQRVLMKAFQIDLSAFNKLRPIFVSNIIAESILSRDNQLPLDSYLWRYAEQEEKQLVGIESYQEQINILKSIPIDYQLKSLMGIGKNVKKYRRQILSLTRYYENSELSKLYKSGKASLGKLRKLLLYRRNKVMGERIAKLISQNSVFCSIGAGHLAGNKGVLKILKSKGFTLKPVSLF